MTDKPKFEVGDKVALITGDMPLTVEQIDGDDVVCTRFVNEMPIEEIYRASHLRHYDP